MSSTFGQSGALARTVADVDLIELARSRISGLRKVANTGGGEWHGPCPACQGTDRFVVNGTGGSDDRGLFWCRSCGATGDAIDFVKLVDGCDDAMAFRALGIGSADFRPTHTPAAATPQEPVEPPPLAWRRAAADLLQEACAVLWSDAGAKARAYLHGRGLADTTIADGKLGYLASDTYVDRADWGLEASGSSTRILLPRGILIPSIVEGEPWRLEVRRPVGPADVCVAPGMNLTTIGQDATGKVWQALKSTSFASASRLATLTRLDVEQVGECLDWLLTQQLITTPAKYLTIAGSANTVWGHDDWQPGRPGVIVEGALNGLSIRQCHPGVNVAALGAATHGRKIRWVMALARWSAVLVALDAETDPTKQSSIEQAASWWVDALKPLATRWRPLGKDCNAMLMDGADLHQWVDAGLAARAEGPENAPARATQTAMCVRCGTALTVASAEVCVTCATPAPVWRSIDLDGAVQVEAPILDPVVVPVAASTPAPQRGLSADYWFEQFSERLLNAPAEIEELWQSWMTVKGTPAAREIAEDLRVTEAGGWLLRTYQEWQAATKIESLITA